MSQVTRLAVLLRSFRLPPTATSAELRQAYLREAKRLHPDRRSDGDKTRATQEFADLQARFAESTALLEVVSRSPQLSAARKMSPNQQGYGAPGAASVDDPWAAAAAPPGARPSAVPTVGMNSQLVYTATALAAIVCAVQAVWSRADQEAAPAAGVAKRPKPSAAQKAEQGTPRQAPDGAPAVGAAAPDAALSGPADVGGNLGAASALEGNLAGYYKALARANAKGKGGPSYMAVHAAAAAGEVWWLERCGASASCRLGVDRKDPLADTPLHHCARHGQALACRTLLRLGADPRESNRWSLLPEHLAAHEGHEDVAKLLREANPKDLAAREAVARHADGLGVLTVVPPELLFHGPHAELTLQHAVNFAAGETVLRDTRLLQGYLPEEGGPVRGSEEAAKLALDRVRGAILGTAYRLEPEAVTPEMLAPGDHSWEQGGDAAEVCGLLVFELPRKVTADAPGHWLALRRGPAGQPGPGETAGDGPFYRLDPVRGPYRLSGEEAQTLLSRHLAWRVVRLASSAMDLVPS